jgi:hypothetical protein
MSNYPRNPKTGEYEKPPFAGLGMAVFEGVAMLFIGFVVITLCAMLGYACFQMWVVMLP